MRHDTWTVVAGASSATILAADARLRTYDVVMELEHPSSRAKGHELMADDRGRTRPRHKNAARGSAVAYKTPPHEVEAEAFSRELAEQLRLARSRNRFETLILVAAPEFLGMLRDALDAPTQGCVRGSVAKNFTNERYDDALAHVRRELQR